MKKTLYLVLILVLISCKENYTYIEIIDEKSIFGDVEETTKESEIIKAKNDSLAYLEAYKKFQISLKIAKEMKEASGDIYKFPKNFRIENSEGKSIKYSISSENRKKAEAELDKIINRLPNFFKANN